MQTTINKWGTEILVLWCTLNESLSFIKVSVTKNEFQICGYTVNF